MQYFWNFVILIAILWDFTISIAIILNVCNTYYNTFKVLQIVLQIILQNFQKKSVCNTFVIFQYLLQYFWDFAILFAILWKYCNTFCNTLIFFDIHYVTLILLGTYYNSLIRSNTCSFTIFRYYKHYFKLGTLNQSNMKYLFYY